MKKILYIEDHKDTADAVKIILESVGFQVSLSLSGEDGVLRAKEGFDLILIDIMLPGMSGWDVFTKIKDGNESKFAFLSAIPVSIDRLKELRKAGVSDYIHKR